MRLRLGRRHSALRGALLDRERPLHGTASAATWGGRGGAPLGPLLNVSCGPGCHYSCESQEARPGDGDE